MNVRKGEGELKLSSQIAIEKERIEKFLIYKLVKQKPKTQSWDVLEKSGSRLGIIEWYPPLRHYCFFPEKLTVYSDRCLQSIKDFVTKLNEEHKQKVK